MHYDQELCGDISQNTFKWVNIYINFTIVVYISFEVSHGDRFLDSFLRYAGDRFHFFFLQTAQVHLSVL